MKFGVAPRRACVLDKATVAWSIELVQRVASAAAKAVREEIAP